MPAPTVYEVEDALLARIVDRLVEAAAPEEIILFGSRAKGTSTGASDLDLCVIADLGGTRRERRKHLHTLAREHLGRNALPVDVLTYTPAEFARERRLLNSVTYFIEKHGRTLYRRPGLPENDRYNAMPEPSKEEHEDWVRRWFTKADRDLRTTRMTLDADDPMPDVACYHAQQAAEKCLKGFLTARGEEIEKTHALEKLLDRCTPLDDSFEELRDACETLKGYAVDIRYPDVPPEPDAEEARAARDAAERICAFVRKRVDLDG